MTTDEFKQLQPGAVPTYTASWGECMYLLVEAVDTDIDRFIGAQGIVLYSDTNPEAVSRGFWIKEYDRANVARVESYIGVPK